MRVWCSTLIAITCSDKKPQFFSMRNVEHALCADCTSLEKVTIRDLGKLSLGQKYIAKCRNQRLTYEYVFPLCVSFCGIYRADPSRIRDNTKKCEKALRKVNLGKDFPVPFQLRDRSVCPGGMAGLFASRDPQLFPREQYLRKSPQFGSFVGNPFLEP